MPTQSTARSSSVALASAVAAVGGAALLLALLSRRRKQQRGSLAAAEAEAGRVIHLHRFAIKGLERDDLGSVYLEKGGCFPNDRRWGFLRHEEVAGFDPQAPVWIHKDKFFAACSAGVALARLTTSFDDESSILTIKDKQSQSTLLCADLRHASSRLEVERFFGGFLADEAGRLARIKLVTPEVGVRHQFGNTTSGREASGNLCTVHLLNLATVRDFNAAAGVDVDPLIFRANLIFDGIDPWGEFAWLGETIAVGDEVRMRIIKRTIRCAATTVDLKSMAAGPDVPALLAKHFPQHGPYLGVYGQVVRGGTIRPGDRVRRVATSWW